MEKLGYRKFYWDLRKKKIRIAAENLFKILEAIVKKRKIFIFRGVIKGLMVFSFGAKGQRQ